MSNHHVVLVSGGLDSATVLALAARAAIVDPGHTTLTALTIGYGQRHDAELESAAAVARHYGATHLVEHLPRRLFVGGALTGSTPMPSLTYEELAEQRGPSPTYVPYRNGTFLSCAAALARSLCVGDDDRAVVWAGMHAEDGVNWAYPDCRPEFLDPQADAIRVGTYGMVELSTPLIEDTKADVVRRGLDMSVPYELTLSCYEGTSPACGKCPTCLGRRAAFTANDTVDPIPYAPDTVSA